MTRASLAAIAAVCAFAPLRVTPAQTAMQSGTLPAAVPMTDRRTATGEADIKSASAEFQRFYGAQIVSADRRARSLNRSVKTQRAILKIGQYIGGGGAVAFGLNDKGRNAAWSGFVAATFTLVDNIFTSDEKVTERAACKQVTAGFNRVVNSARLWSAQASDPAFQARFPLVLDSMQTVIGESVNNGTCDYRLPDAGPRDPLSQLRDVRTRFNIR